MAEENVELAPAEAQGEQAAANKGGMMKMLIMAVAGLVLLGGTVFGTLMLTGALDEEPLAQDAVADEPAQKAPTNEAIYLALDPPFTVSLDQDAERRYLQVTMSVMARDERVIDAVRKHRPAIRDGLNLLLAGQRYEDISSREGKEKLRELAQEEIRRILTDNGEKSELEALYFTQLVVD